MVATAILINGSRERLEGGAVSLADLQQLFTEKSSAYSVLLHKKAHVVKDSCELDLLLRHLDRGRLYISPSGWGAGAAPESIQLCVPENSKKVLGEGLALNLSEAPEDVAPATLYDSGEGCPHWGPLFGAIWEQEHMKVDVMVPGSAGDSRLAIPITPHTTGAGLKGAVQAQAGIPRGEQILYVSRPVEYEGLSFRCEDGRLADQHIYPGSTLRVFHVKPDTRTMSLSVKTSSGSTLKLSCYPSNTIWEVKGMIQEAEGSVAHGQRLIFAGNQLEDDRSLDDYNINDGSTVHMVLRLCGGMYHWTSGRHDLEQLAPQREVGFVLPDGSILPLTCPGHATIGEVKRLLLHALEQRSREEAVAAALANPDSTDDVAVLREALRTAQAQLGGQAVEAPQRSNRRRQRTPSAAPPA